MEIIIFKIVFYLFCLGVFASMHELLMDVKRDCKEPIEKIQFWAFALIFYILSIVGIVSTF